MKSGSVVRQIFLLSALSHDDFDQWALIPYWVDHYVTVLDVKPENFLLILHSDSGNHTGILEMANWFAEEYMIRKIIGNTEPYKSHTHMILKNHLLRKYVSPNDWVIQVDSDELLFLPLGKNAKDTVEEMEREKFNVHYGAIIDRLAEDGSLDEVPSGSRSIFDQFPLNCAATLILQHSDIRKASLYRGYFRTDEGGHAVIAYNKSMQRAAHRNQRLVSKSRRALLDSGGKVFYDTLPDSYLRGNIFPALRPAWAFATLYHFKWIKGVYSKLVRRNKTEPGTSWFYSYFLEGYSLQNSTKKYFDPDMLCNDLRTAYPRALAGREMFSVIGANTLGMDGFFVRNKRFGNALEHGWWEAIGMTVNKGIVREDGYGRR